MASRLSSHVAARVSCCAAVAIATAALFVGISLRGAVHQDLDNLLQNIDRDLLIVSRPASSGRFRTSDIACIAELSEVATVAGQGLEVTHHLPGQEYTHTWLEVTASFPEVYGLALSEGRSFGPDDEDAILLGAEVAEVVFGVQNPLGEVLEASPVIGVLARIPEEDIVRERLNRRVLTLRVPSPEVGEGESAGDEPSYWGLVLRAKGSPSEAERAVRSLYPDAQVLRLGTLYRLTIHGSDLALQRALLLGAGLLLAIAASSMAVLASLSAMRRRREVGIRRACGATSSQVRTSLLGESLLVSLTGALMGGAAGASALLLLRQPLAISVFHLIPLPMACAVGLCASWLPASVASRLPPASQIRSAIRSSPLGLAVIAQVAVSVSILLATSLLTVLSGTVGATRQHLRDVWGSANADILVVRNPRESILPSPDLSLDDSILIEEIPGILAVAPYTVYGLAPDITLALVDSRLLAFGMLELTAGQMLSSRELQTGEPTCMVSDELAQRRFNSDSPGKEFSIRGQVFHVVGEFDRSLAFPVDVIVSSFFLGLIPPSDSRFLVRANRAPQAASHAEQIAAAFRSRYPDCGGVLVESASAVQSEVSGFFRSASLRLALMALVAATLTFGEVGVLVGFLIVSRSRELAIHRAVGGTRRALIVLVSRWSALVFLPGIALGSVLGALLITPFLRHVLYISEPLAAHSLLLPPLAVLLVAGAMTALRVLHVVSRPPACLLARHRE